MVANTQPANSYLSGKKILVIGTEPWFGPLLSKHRLVLELCKQNQVVYVEPIFHLGSLLRKPKELFKFFKNASQYLLSPNWLHYHNESPANFSRIRPIRLPKSSESKVLRNLSEWLFIWQLMMRKLKPDVIISFNPYFGFLTRRCEIFVYYPVDSFSVDGAHPDVARCEDEILHLADIVAAGTYKRYQELTGKVNFLRFLPHGVDIEALISFSDRLPSDLAHLPSPLIGFLGTVNARLDFSLLQHIAQTHPEWSLVMVGPYKQGDFCVDKVEQNLNPLMQLANVYLLGPRPSHEVGAYFRAFDVSIMPYDTNHPMVHFASHKPLQCLAVGTPVITTCTAPSEVLPPNTKVAETATDFVNAIATTLNSFTADMRDSYIAAASDYTWTKRISELSEWITEYKNSGRSPNGKR